MTSRGLEQTLFQVLNSAPTGGIVMLAYADASSLCSSIAAVTAERDRALKMLADAPHDWAGCGLVRAQQRTDACTCWKAGL